MTKSIVILFITLLAVSCQNKKADQAAAMPAVETPVAPVASTSSVATAKIDESLFTTPLGQRLKADFNPTPGSQGSIDQNIIVEYVLKNNLDVKRTASGLYYMMEKEGKGNTAKASDIVTINYKGYLLDGTEFDNSYKKGQPLTYGVSDFVPGWTEALQLMKPGSKIKLIVPSALGYGQMGTPGGPIGPNAVLAFDMDLLSIGK